MDSQILGLLGLAALMGFGLWLMFGKPGNKKPSGQNPDDWQGSPNSGPKDAD
jgi:heme A synthase